MGDVTPEEAAAIRSSVAGREQAPGTRQQAAIFSNWREAADRLGSPFEVEHIPISKLRAMRRDPMLFFGLSFIKTPHVRARWFINARSNAGPNAALAAHLDYDLRRIWASFVLQYFNSLDFGFQPIVKRYEVHTPAAFYIETNPDTGERQELPAWSEGGIEPIAWKPFVALPPEGVEPIWKGDDFNGISYQAPESATSGSGEKPKEIKIDVYHSLWVTNEQAQNFSSIWGYPLLGYAYRYWWSYWFRWAIADRAFERKADPSVKVYHPDGEFVDDISGQTLSYGEYALMIGERMRSGGVIALPSETYEDIQGRGTMRQWDIDFTKEAVNFDPFDKSFEYLDVQKLRSLAIPEQAFLEGKGGTSSRNVAAEMGESFVESQAVRSKQLQEVVNRFVIPQWVAVNYPEFLADGGSATLEIQGFADQDIEFARAVIQLIGQDALGAQEMLKLVDLEKMLDDAGMPIADIATQTRRENEIAQQATLQGPPAVAGIPGQQVGTAPAPTGFNAYINPPDHMRIELAAPSTEFIKSLPDSQHYQDQSVRSYARQLFNIYRGVYADELATAVEAIRRGGEVQEEDAPVEAAISDMIGRATALLRQWQRSQLWPSALDRSKDLFQKIANRAATLESKRVSKGSQLDPEDRDAWIDDHMTDFAVKVADTTRSEIQDFLSKRMEEMEAEQGAIDTDKLADEVQEHFSDFADWKARRVARTETRNVYNAATLLAARAADIARVQAIDAQYGETDKDCEDRDGQIFDVDNAWDEDEHPNGTLGWRMVPANLSIEYEEDFPAGAVFDDESQTLTLSDQIGRVEQGVILKDVVGRIAGP